MDNDAKMPGCCMTFDMVGRGAPEEMLYYLTALNVNTLRQVRSHTNEVRENRRTWGIRMIGFKWVKKQGSIN